MKKDINRCAALTGLAAIAAAAFPATLSAAIRGADDELFALMAQWEKGKELEISFGAEHTAMERKAKAAEPPTPAALLQPLDWNGENITPRFPRGWCKDEIAIYAPHKAKELLSITADYEASRDIIWAEARAGQERFDEIVSANTDIINRIGETPAHTLQGLMAKCRVAQAEGLFVNFMDFSDFAQSIHCRGFVTHRATISGEGLSQENDNPESKPPRADGRSRFGCSICSPSNRYPSET